MIAMNMPSRIESGQFVEVAIIVHRKKNHMPRAMEYKLHFHYLDKISYDVARGKDR